MTNVKAQAFFSYPAPEEAREATKAVCGRCCTECETPAEYAWRKRDITLERLLRDAIESELTEREREAILLIYYGNKTVMQTASLLGKSPSTVFKLKNSAEDKLRRVLRYVVAYQHDSDSDETEALAFMRARCLAGAKAGDGSTVGQRLEKLRMSSCISPDAIARVLGIGTGRLRSIEKDSALPDAEEIGTFADFYGTTADYIIGGKTDGGKKNS